MDTVVAYRQRYLASYQKEEDIEKFKQFSGMQSEWETVKSKIRADKDREAAANQ